MSEWKETTTEEIIASSKGSLISGPFGSNISSKYFVNVGVPVIRGNNLSLDIGTKFIDKNFVFITQSKAEELNTWAIKDDIIFTAAGTIGQVGIIKNTNYDRYIISNKQIRLRIDIEKALPLYIYYWFASSQMIETIMSMDTGSTIPLINLSVVRALPLLLPPLLEQKAIAGVLSSLDDKIDLLHCQNKTLEAMAEALFRQWFVEPCKDGLPERWDIANLSDVAEVQNGYSFSSKDFIDYSENTLEVLKMGHIEKGGGLRANPKKDYVPRTEKLSKFILNKNDIVMAMTDMKDNVVILGVPALIDKNNHYVLNQRVARIFLRTNKVLLNNYLLYIQLKDPENIAILQSKANSGVQVNLTTQTIKDIQIIIPPTDFQKDNTPVLAEIYQKKEANRSQIRTLEKMRNTLLPKLMSGEVRVEF